MFLHYTSLHVNKLLVCCTIGVLHLMWVFSPSQNALMTSKTTQQFLHEFSQNCWVYSRASWGFLSWWVNTHGMWKIWRGKECALTLSHWIEVPRLQELSTMPNNIAALQFMSAYLMVQFSRKSWKNCPTTYLSILKMPGMLECSGQHVIRFIHLVRVYWNRQPDTVICLNNPRAQRTLSRSWTPWMSPKRRAGRKNSSRKGWDVLQNVQAVKHASNCLARPPPRKIFKFNSKNRFDWPKTVLENPQHMNHTAVQPPVKSLQKTT